MTKHALYVATALLMVGLAGCGGGSEAGSKPEGQVIAKVGGHEVTARELNLELTGVERTNPEVAKAAEQRAIDVIVNRKIFAAAAREEGLHKHPEFQLQRQRAEEVMLAQALQAMMAGKVAQPTPDEAEQYMAKHPNSFANRKIFVLDQVQFPRTTSPEVLKSLAPLKTMQEVEQLLLQSGIEYRRLPGSLDARGAPPEMVDKIANMPSDSVFVIPNGNMLVASQIKETRTVPFTGEEAVKQAQQILMKERVDQELRKQAEQLRKANGTVQYKDGYGRSETNQSAPAKS